MPTQCNRDLFGYEVVEGRQVVAAFDGGEIISDAGALLLGVTDRKKDVRNLFWPAMGYGERERMAIFL